MCSHWIKIIRKQVRIVNQRNYQRELDDLLKKLDKEQEKKMLFLHCCCAPCSSYVTEYLSSHFHLVLFFYNPNITEQEEYEKRKKELIRLVSEKKYPAEIRIVDATYDNHSFFEMVKGLEKEPERGKRCFLCYEMRLRETAKAAVDYGADYFCTTLSISPHKDADKLMELGEQLGEEYGIAYLPSDFKKKNGYKRSIELSKEYQLYRQNYCGCVFSRQQAEEEGRSGCNK